MSKVKRNSVELTGNLVADVVTSETARFITVAIYNGKDESGKLYKSTFVPITIFDDAVIENVDLVKGERISIIGKISMKNSETQKDGKEIQTKTIVVKAKKIMPAPLVKKESK